MFSNSKVNMIMEMLLILNLNLYLDFYCIDQDHSHLSVLFYFIREIDDTMIDSEIRSNFQE